MRFGDELRPGQVLIGKRTRLLIQRVVRSDRFGTVYAAVAHDGTEAFIKILRGPHGSRRSQLRIPFALTLLALAALIASALLLGAAFLRV